LQPPGLVVDQRPRTGYRSSYDPIMLVVTKATQGLIPNLVGRNVNDARARLKKLKIVPTIRWTVGKPGKVISQRPRAGVAAAPGVKVELVVAKATANVEAAG
jgi:beta-lactam-binding protein with PASTA domain